MLAPQVYAYFCKQPIPPFSPLFYGTTSKNEALARGLRFFQVLVLAPGAIVQTSIY
jgi:hypothetical protein